MSEMFSTGAMINGEHHYHSRVYYADTDAAGVVYYANYMVYAERARTEMLRCLDMDLIKSVAETGCTFVVREMVVDYLRPALLGDSLAVVTKIARVGGASLEIEQNVRRGQDDLVQMKLKLVYVKIGERSLRMPPDMRATLQELVKETD